MRFLKIFALLGITAITLSACCSNCRQNKSSEIKSLTETTWQVIQFEGKAFDAKGDSYTLKFEDNNAISGKGDCNRLMGGYTVSDKGVLDLSKMGSTRMMCPDQATESKFLQLLAAVDGFAIDGNLLMLLKNGEVQFTLKAVEAAE